MPATSAAAPKPDPLQAQWHNDPGHGWLVLPRQSLGEVGLTEADISPYSYAEGYLVALEEDCDGPAFIAAAERAGRVIAYAPEVTTNSDSRIRGWSKFGTKVSA
jgi:hypothetical protein